MNKTFILKLAAFIGVAGMLPLPAFAHPGAGHIPGFSAGFSHPFGGMDHMLAMVAVGFWAAQMGGRAVWAVPCAFVGTMVLGGLVGTAGLSMPYVEQGILASILVLGVLIAGAFKFSVAASGALVGAFALFHGYAHGVEIPADIAAVSYSAGFSLATLALHSAGLLAGSGGQKLYNGRVSRFIGFVIAFGGAFLALS